MNSQTDVEDVLQRLGRDWPEGDSIVEEILEKLDSVSPSRAKQTWVWSGLNRIVLFAASVTVCVGLWWATSGERSVYAQTRDAIRRAHSFQATSRLFSDDGKQVLQTLTQAFERGVGFHEEWPMQISVGNQNGSWHYKNGEKLATKTKGLNISAMIDRYLEQGLGKNYADATYERHPSRDQVVDGQPCKAFLVTNLKNGVIAGIDADRQRTVVLKDHRSRIVHMSLEVRPEEEWIVRAIGELKYDVPLDPALFQPKFPNDVRIVDADKAFEEFVDLDHALYREERSGLWYAIHHAERIENGSLFFVTSVRGTEATLKTYPLQERRLSPGKVFIDGPGNQYRTNFVNRLNCFELELAKVDHNGINVLWWLLVPYDENQTASFDIENGKVNFPAHIHPSFSQFWKDNYTDEKGITHPITWDIELDVPTPAQFRSLESIARNVHSDLMTFEGVPFKSPNMGNRGLMPTFSYDMNKITEEAYAKAVAGELRWWKNGCPMDDARAADLRKDPLPAKYLNEYR